MTPEAKLSILEAINAIDKQLKANLVTNQENGKLSAKKGSLLFDLEEHEKAIEAYKKALYFYKKHILNINKRNVGTAYYKIAQSYEALDQKEEAIIYYDKAYNESGKEMMLLLKARLLEAIGDEKTALRTFQKYGALLNRKFDLSKDPAPMFKRLQLNIERKQYEQALLAIDSLKHKAKQYDGIEKRIAKFEKDVMTKLENN